MSISGGNRHDHPHILVYPYPAQGHMLPLLDLTNQLALRGLTITIVVTPKNLPILTPLLSTHPSIQTLVLPFPAHPKIPPGVENVRDLGIHGNLSVINALANLHDPIFQWFNSHANPPVALISDFFLGYTLRLADTLKIPRITFFSSGAFLVSIHEYCWRNLDLVHSSSTVVDFPYLPRSPSLKKEHVPSIVLAHRGTDPKSELLRISMLANTQSWGCVFNTFQDLEGDYLDHLKRRMGHNRVLRDSGADVMAWLDGCPDGSVLYVCFGSQKLLNSQQMEALANGLDWSGVRFVWAVKTGSAQEVKDGYGVVPEGFEKRVAGRGWLELRDKAFGAVRDGGSSLKDLDELVKQLSQF
ncbi:hypothetical protein M0R45_022054 [Rubus argutus]|uniref:UDP-glycosyltransferase 89A2 n=1 Tax=Rubus argutus TaxID=59490 RepID=A0AAW1XFG7_RUBAR